MNNFSLAACLLLALTASVSERYQKVPELVASIFCKLEICDKRNQESAPILLQTPWQLMKAQIDLIGL